jgi:alcohol dehydrogenase class IV
VEVPVMMELRKFVAPEFVFGKGAVSLVGRYAVNFGARKPLIVTDAGVIAAGLAKKAMDHLEAENIEYAVFSDVNQNPRDFQVMEGAKFYADNGCDLVIAIGGGSPLDCAKGIGIVSTNQNFILDYEGVDNVRIPGPPLICLPTTAGTSADVSQFAIINDVTKKRKFAIISKTMVPDVALIDPEMTLTMPSYLTACTGMDALVHAIEAIASTASSRITDLHAIEAIRVIRETLPAAVSHGDDLEARDRMMFASMEAGLAFSNASLGAVHALAHSLGGLLDMPHGECNAVLLTHVIRFNFAKAPDRYRVVAECLGIDAEKYSNDSLLPAIIDDIEALKSSVGIAVRLGEKGLNPAVLPQLSMNAINDPCMITNPRIPTQKEVEQLYADAI